MNGMHENFPYTTPDIDTSDQPAIEGGTDSLVIESGLAVNIATTVVIPPEFAKRGSNGITEYLRIILCDTSLRHPNLTFRVIVHPTGRGQA